MVRGSPVRPMCTRQQISRVVWIHTTANDRFDHPLSIDEDCFGRFSWHLCPACMLSARTAFPDSIDVFSPAEFKHSSEVRVFGASPFVVRKELAAVLRTVPDRAAWGTLWIRNGSDWRESLTHVTVHIPIEDEVLMYGTRKSILYPPCPGCSRQTVESEGHRYVLRSTLGDRHWWFACTDLLLTEELAASVPFELMKDLTKFPVRVVDSPPSGSVPTTPLYDTL